MAVAPRRVERQPWSDWRPLCWTPAGIIPEYRDVGHRLYAIVERVRTESSGLPNIDLARLNLRTGRPLSRIAMDIPDDPALVALAEAVADEILGTRSKRGTP